MLDMLIQYVGAGVEVARVWGPLLIIALMAIESSVIPLPSEVVLIPVGVMIARGEFPLSEHAWVAVAVATVCGLIGSVLGASVNYGVSAWLGRPVLHRYGKYFFLGPRHLNRAEEVFREYGEVTTFVCRLLPGIRHLISIPAGLAEMNFRRFTIFTAAGAGIWSLVLTMIGYTLGQSFAERSKSYRDIILDGKRLLSENTGWVILGSVVIIGAYALLHRHVMKEKTVVPDSEKA